MRKLLPALLLFCLLVPSSASASSLPASKAAGVALSAHERAADIYRVFLSGPLGAAATQKALVSRECLALEQDLSSEEIAALSQEDKEYLLMALAYSDYSRSLKALPARRAALISRFLEKRARDIFSSSPTRPALRIARGLFAHATIIRSFRTVSSFDSCTTLQLWREGGYDRAFLQDQVYSYVYELAYDKMNVALERVDVAVDRIEAVRPRISVRRIEKFASPISYPFFGSAEKSCCLLRSRL